VTQVSDGVYNDEERFFNLLDHAEQRALLEDEHIPADLHVKLHDAGFCLHPEDSEAEPASAYFSDGLRRVLNDRKGLTDSADE
jgi:hypothetical protein